MKVSDVLPAMVERIVRLFAPERIVLFGSQARGDARPDSDLDRGHVNGSFFRPALEEGRVLYDRR